MTEVRCKVCSHPDREEIDAALVSGTPNTTVAARWELSKDSVRRHLLGHLSAALRAVQEQREHGGPRRAVERAEALYGKASRILEAAEADGKAALSLSAVRELRSVVELIARLSGELDERPQVQVLNVQASPEWVSVRAVLLEALRPFPEAGVAVAEALAGARALGGGAGV